VRESESDGFRFVLALARIYVGQHGEFRSAFPRIVNY